MFRKRLQKVLSSILCLTLVMMSFIGLGSIETAKAAVSPLITPYKPQVVNVDANVSYIDSTWEHDNGNHPPPRNRDESGGFG